MNLIITFITLFSHSAHAQDFIKDYLFDKTGTTMGGRLSDSQDEEKKRKEQQDDDDRKRRQSQNQGTSTRNNRAQPRNRNIAEQMEARRAEMLRKYKAKVVNKKKQ